jgi:hypothetical protein
VTAKTIIVRWWFEPSPDEAVNGQVKLRGTMLASSGHILGHFEGFDALAQKLRDAMLSDAGGPLVTHEPEA